MDYGASEFIWTKLRDWIACATERGKRCKIKLGRAVRGSLLAAVWNFIVRFSGRHLRSGFVAHRERIAEGQLTLEKLVWNLERAGNIQSRHLVHRTWSWSNSSSFSH